MKGSRLAVLCLGWLVVFGAVMGTRAQWNPLNPVESFEKRGHALEVRQKDGRLHIEVDTPEVLHVTYAPLDTTAPERAWDHVIVKRGWGTDFGVSSDEKAVTLTTAKLKVQIERATGAIHYQSADGKALTTDSYRSLHPVEVNGEKTFHAEVYFGIYGSHEGLYGLGQHQAGRVELSRRDGGAVAGEHEHCDSAAGFDEWIWDLLEQPVAERGEQPALSTRCI